MKIYLIHKIFIFPVGLDAVILNKNRSLTEDFTKLYLELEKEGYFEPSYVQAFLRLMELFVLTGIGLVLLNNQYFVMKLFGVFFITVMRVRGAFLTHEQGHYSYIGNPKVERVIHSITDGK